MSGKECLHSFSRKSKPKEPTNKIKKLAAFTLAEVLITLAIIGIVAAISIPTVITNYQKNTYVTQLKKFYTGTTNGLRAYMASQGATKLTDTELWAKITGSSINVSTLMSTPAVKDEFSKIFRVLAVYNSSQLQSLYPNLKKKELNTNSVYNYSDGNAVTLADGAIISSFTFNKTPSSSVVIDGGNITELNTLNKLHDYENANGLPITALYQSVGHMWVDVNGFKGPNVNGRDIFGFYVGNDGMLYPRGGIDYAVLSRRTGYSGAYWKTSSESSENCSTTASSMGYGCVARIMEEGWKMTY